MTTSSNRSEPKLVWADPARVRPNSWNTNHVGPENEARLTASIDRLGYFKPIIVRHNPDGDTDWEILGGEHRWRDAIEKGADKVPLFDLGQVDDKTAKEIGVADNGRYGVDDMAQLAKLLDEIGGAEVVQEFLPFSDAEMSTIFSASSIELTELGLDENFEDPAAPSEKPEKAAKAAKTHTIMRFKVPLQDAERITALIARTMKDQGFVTGDELTNAGDALVHLIGGAS